MDSFGKELYVKNKSELDGYIFIDHYNLMNIKLGSIIKYCNSKGYIKYGGILIKVFEGDKYNHLKLILKLGSYTYTLNYSKKDKLYFFYKPVIKKTIKNKREIFLSILSELQNNIN
jgi:hypothetical protein